MYERTMRVRASTTINYARFHCQLENNSNNAEHMKECVSNDNRGIKLSRARARRLRCLFVRVSHFRNFLLHSRRCISFSANRFFLERKKTLYSLLFSQLALCAVDERTRDIYVQYCLPRYISVCRIETLLSLKVYSNQNLILFESWTTNIPRDTISPYFTAVIFHRQRETARTTRDTRNLRVLLTLITVSSAKFRAFLSRIKKSLSR